MNEITGLIVFAILIGGVILYVRYRRNASPHNRNAAGSGSKRTRHHK